MIGLAVGREDRSRTGQALVTTALTSGHGLSGGEKNGQTCVGNTGCLHGISRL